MVIPAGEEETDETTLVFKLKVRCTRSNNTNPQNPEEAYVNSKGKPIVRSLSYLSHCNATALLCLYTDAHIARANSVLARSDLEAGGRASGALCR